MKQFANARLIQSIFIFLFFLSCNKPSENPVPINEIPNANFENWGTLNEFDKPDNWGTSNFSLFSVISFNTVTKDGIEKFSGKFCPRLETKSQIIGDAEVKVAGLITLGAFEINLATRKARVSGGLPFISKPVRVEGYYKYNGVGIDRCFIDIAITKFNSVSRKQDTIGSGQFSSASIPDWALFKIPINYHLNETPDSINIVILSSDTSVFEAGSTMWIDSLSLKY